MKFVKQVTFGMAMGGLVLGMATGCASTQEKGAVETVQNAKDRVNVTDEYLKKAEDAFKNFEDRLATLKADASQNAEMRGKQDYSKALSGFDQRLIDARAELHHMKITNDASWAKYKEQIRSADQAMRSDFNKSNNTADNSDTQKSEKTAE